MPFSIYIMIKNFKRWYWILTFIWIAFWILDMLVLVPFYPEEGIVYNIRAIFADELDLALSYLIITAPIYLYLLLMLVNKMIRLVSKLIRKIKQKIA
jgi:hypothetical protein